MIYNANHPVFRQIWSSKFHSRNSSFVFREFQNVFYHLNQHKNGKIRQNCLNFPQQENSLCDEQLGLNEYGNIVYINNAQSACAK